LLFTPHNSKFNRYSAGTKIGNKSAKKIAGSCTVFSINKNKKNHTQHLKKRHNPFFDAGNQFGFLRFPCGNRRIRYLKTDLVEVCVLPDVPPPHEQDEFIRIDLTIKGMIAKRIPLRDGTGQRLPGNVCQANVC
jgi:hypothetical protein